MGKIRSIIEWHKELTTNVACRLGLSNYQLLWVAFAKGLAIGYLLG